MMTSHQLNSAVERSTACWISPSRLATAETRNSGRTTRVQARAPSDVTITVLADNYQGKRFNSPNDLAFDSKGRIYFTDPRYGDREDMQIVSKDGRPVEGVYRIDPDGTITEIIANAG